MLIMWPHYLETVSHVVAVVGNCLRILAYSKVPILESMWIVQKEVSMKDVEKPTTSVVVATAIISPLF
jgi:hypothetical protein